MKTNHCKQDIQEFLDGRLKAVRRKEVEEHLRECMDCRKEMEALALLKRTLSTNVIHQAPPDTLKDAILRNLDLQDQTEERTTARAYGWKIALAFTVLVVALAGIWYIIQNRKPSELPVIVASDFKAVRSGILELQLQTDQTDEMELHFRNEGIPFATRVFDLQMMEYRLRGGSVNKVGEKVSALFIYVGPDQRILVCQMFEGSANALPSGAETRENDGILFYIYRVGEVTTVFWQEGDVTCALASDASLEEVVSLAFAKAIRI